jgi:hypothetical protein
MPESGPPLARCGTCGAPIVGDKPMEQSRRLLEPYHAAVSWTYIRGERAEEALLRIRKVLKEAVGWWNAQDEADYEERVPNG